MSAMADLDRLEQDLSDVEVVLACLSTDRREVCDICRIARADASIAERPALAACAADKLPLEVPLDLG